MSEYLLKRRAADCASEEEIYGADEAHQQRQQQHQSLTKKDLAPPKNRGLQQADQEQQYHHRFEQISSSSTGSRCFSQSDFNTFGGQQSLFAEDGGPDQQYTMDVQGYMTQNQSFIMSPPYAHHPPIGYYQFNNNGGTTTTTTTTAHQQSRQGPTAGDDDDVALHARTEQHQQLLPFHNATQQNGIGKEKPTTENDQNAMDGQIEAPIPPPYIHHHHHHHHVNLLMHNRSPFEPFCTVPGRMSLLSGTTKYKVSIGEIQRRINPPECLNASLIGGILRKAKSKDGGKALRESLKRIGLSLPAGRRKSACVTAFTALVEEEAIHMANDFNAVLQHDFPSKDIGFFLNAQFLRFSGQNSVDAELVARRRTILNFSRIFIKELTNLIAADRSPICDRRPELVLDPNIQKYDKLKISVLARFINPPHGHLITHGFGGIAMLSLLDSLSTCLDESLKNLDKLVETRIVVQQQQTSNNDHHHH